MSFGSSSDKKTAESGIQQAGQDVKQASQQTPQEAAQYSGSFDIGQYLQQLFGGQVGMNSMPANAMTGDQQFQNQSPLNQSIYSNVLNQAQNPTAGWQSTLAPQLQQAQEQINTYYQKRGLLNSGIAIGDMGTAGVDLAIQNAQNEMQYQQQSLQNALGLSQNIQGVNQQNIGNLANLYNAQQGYGQQSLGRQAQGAAQAAQYQAYPYQAQLGDYYGGRAALQALPGQLIGTAGKVAAAYAGGA